MSLFSQNNGFNNNSKNKNKHSHRHSHVQTSGWSMLFTYGIVSIVAALIVWLTNIELSEILKTAIIINGLVGAAAIIFGKSTYEKTHGVKKD